MPKFIITILATLAPQLLLWLKKTFNQNKYKENEGKVSRQAKSLANDCLYIMNRLDGRGVNEYEELRDKLNSIAKFEGYFIHENKELERTLRNLLNSLRVKESSIFSKK